MKQVSILLGLFIILGGSEISAQALAPIVGGLSATPTRPAPRSVFWNPALIGVESRTQIDTNITLVGGWMVYDREGTNPNTGKAFDSSALSEMAPLPYFSMSSSLGSKKFRFGYSTYLPSGVFADFNSKGAQRYQLIQGMHVPWHHQLTVAYKPNDQWTIGISGIYSLGLFKSKIAMDLSRFMEKVLNSDQVPKESSVLEAQANIPLSTAHGLGAALGVYYTPSYQWAFGFGFSSPIFYRYGTRLELKTPAAVSTIGSGLKALGVEETINMKVSAHAVLPPVFHFGVAYQPYGYWTMEFFGRYALTSLWPSLEVHVHQAPVEQAKNFTRHGHKLGDHFLAGTVQSFQLWQRWNLGINFNYSSSAVQDHYLAVSLADFDSILSGAFLQYRFSKRWTFGAEYAHSFMLTRVAKNTSSGSPEDLFPAPSSDGVYKASADRLGLMFNYDF